MHLRYPVSGRRAATLGLLAGITFIRVAKADALDEVQKSSEAWIQTRLEATRTESEWTTQRELLTSTLAAYRDRAAVEVEKRDFAKAKTAKNREEIDMLRGKTEAAKADLAAGDARLKALTAKLETFRAKLPPHLAQGLEFAFRSLHDSNLTPAERMQFTMTVLTRCAQFDRTITQAEEIVVIDGKPKALEAIYWGLSHGYALDRKTGQAWLGRPGTTQWTWEPAMGATDSVARLLAIYEGKVDPQFVFAPVRLATAQPSTTGATP
jgi:hypothetical protein